MGAIPQKWIFACCDCGCIFTTMAEKQTGICPVCKSTARNQIEGFDYWPTVNKIGKRNRPKFLVDDTIVQFGIG
jgi:hypothetical protein